MYDPSVSAEPKTTIKITPENRKIWFKYYAIWILPIFVYLCKIMLMNRDYLRYWKFGIFKL